MQFAGKQNVIVDVLPNRLRDGTGLFVDFPQHYMRKAVRLIVRSGDGWSHIRLRLRVNHLPPREQTGTMSCGPQRAPAKIRCTSFGGLMRGCFVFVCLVALTSL